MLQVTVRKINILRIVVIQTLSTAILMPDRLTILSLSSNSIRTEQYSYFFYSIYYCSGHGKGIDHVLPTPYPHSRGETGRCIPPYIP